ncbi:MAG: tetratricopeptide repeat protein [Planctomycetota bacterium]|nr:tetratricopeptide repeat protein [Planctomycetota bacterium]
MKTLVLTATLTLAAWQSASALDAHKPPQDGDLDAWVSEGQWKHAKDAVEPTPAKQLAKAKRLEEIGDVGQAADQFKRLADVYSESEQAEEALILSARNYLSAGNYTKCREMITELRRRYAHPTYLDLLGQVESTLARGYLEGRGEGGTYKLASRVRKARAIYENTYKEDPEGRWADDALLGLGQCDEAISSYDDAIKHYKELLEKYPGSDLRSEAEGHIAACINKREPQPQYEESETAEARRRIEIAKQDAGSPESTIDVVALDENEKMLLNRQAEKRFEQARFYQVNGKYRAAEVYYEIVKTRYPDSPFAKKADEALQELRKR